MKMLLLINKNKLSPEGVYRINKIYSTFHKLHDIVLVQCKRDSSGDNGKIIVRKKKYIFLRKGLIVAINNLLVSFIKERISKKIRNAFGKILVDERIKYYRINSNQINGRVSEERIKELNPDLIIHISSNILKSNIFSIPKIGTINLHHGVLPFIRGLDSVYWGIYYNKPEWVGATVHFIDEGIDTGKILKKGQCEYKSKRSLSSVMIGNEILGTELLLSAIKSFDADDYTGKSYKTELNNIENSIYRSRVPILVLLTVIVKINAQHIFPYFTDNK
jgi:folate-dependent phosphoribosylglycinamide formyltransferase PurN